MEALPLDPIDEVELQTLGWDTVDDTRPLSLLLTLIVARLILDFDQTVVSESTSKANVNDRSELGTTEFATSAGNCLLFDRAWELGIWLLVGRLSGNGKVSKRPISVIRAHPSLSGLVEVFLVGCIGKRRIETVQMPRQAAKVASDNFALAHSRLSALEAQDDVLLVVFELEIVG